MTYTLIATPNGKQHRAKSDSWYFLHFMTEKSRDEYRSLSPEKYVGRDGGIRYKARLPVLLSITSTDDIEVLMDLSDICRCYEIPYHSYLRYQLFLDGSEVTPASGYHEPDTEKYRRRENSWFTLYVIKGHVDAYERLDPTEHHLEDGRIRYKVHLPMLARVPGTAGNDLLVDLDETCKAYRVPSSLIERFESFIDSKEVEHPRNKVTRRIITLPLRNYCIGDPLYLLPDNLLEEFATDKEQLLYRGFQIANICTGGDGEFPLYELEDDEHSGSDSEIPDLIDWLPTDLATISFIPYDLLRSLGMKRRQITDNAFIIETMGRSGDAEQQDLTLTVVERDRSIQYIEFLRYTLLIADTNRFEDLDDV